MERLDNFIAVKFPGFVEKSEEELLKIITRADINNYFVEVIAGILDLKYHLVDEDTLNRVKAALIYGYQQLVMYRNSTDKSGMLAIFKDELSVTMCASGTLNVNTAEIIINSESNTFKVVSYEEQYYGQGWL